MFKHLRDQIRLGLEIGRQQAADDARRTREASRQRINNRTEQAITDMGLEMVTVLGEHCPEEFRQAIVAEDTARAVQAARRFADGRYDIESPNRHFAAALLSVWLMNVDRLRQNARDACRRIGD